MFISPTAIRPLHSLTIREEEKSSIPVRSSRQPTCNGHGGIHRRRRVDVSHVLLPGATRRRERRSQRYSAEAHPFRGGKKCVRSVEQPRPHCRSTRPNTPRKTLDIDGSSEITTSLRSRRRPQQSDTVRDRRRRSAGIYPSASTGRVLATRWSTIWGIDHSSEGTVTI